MSDCQSGLDSVRLAVGFASPDNCRNTVFTRASQFIIFIALIFYSYVECFVVILVAIRI